MKARPFKSLALMSAAAALPMSGGAADAADLPVKTELKPAASWMPKWYFSAEGGALISDYSRTSFPGGVDAATGKLGDIADRTNSGSLAPGHNHGWFGALSIGRDIDPVWDWRLTGTFNSFNRNSRSASGNTFANDLGTIESSSRSVTESDRFRFGTIDFDIGRKSQQGLWQTRTFYGARFLGAEQNLNITDAQAKGFFSTDGGDQFIDTSFNSTTQTRARSHLWAFGPRVGIEGFYGSTFGITGAASAAFLVGWRSSDFEQNQKGSGTLSFCIDAPGPGCFGPITEPLSSSADARRSRFVGVGDLAGSLGLAWRPSQTVTFEAGYKLEFLWNAGESFNFANDKALSGTFDQKKDILVQKPYVKAIIVF